MRWVRVVNGISGWIGARLAASLTIADIAYNAGGNPNSAGVVARRVAAEQQLRRSGTDPRHGSDS